jgi:uncharacterized membrane protein YkvA (DUF1232 family)
MFSEPSVSSHSGSGILIDLVRHLRLVWRLLRDGRVPGWVKTIPVMALLYLLSPIDLVPDWLIPGLGELDDLAVLLLSVKLFVDLSPETLVEHYRQQLAGRDASTFPDDDDAIDATYRVLDESHKP